MLAGAGICYEEVVRSVEGLVAQESRRFLRLPTAPEVVILAGADKD
jgi:hypothetical protein